MPTAKQTCKLIRDTNAILFGCRILVGELVFTGPHFTDSIKLGEC